MLYQSTCVGLGYGLTLGLFPGRFQPPAQSDKRERPLTFVTTSRPRNINLVPIDYGFRPRLRGRLTLRGLALRRNPWTFGDRVSHPVYRYSCQHAHFRYLQQPSRATFTGLRNAPLPFRGQMPEVLEIRFAASATVRGLAASSRSPDIRLARFATSARQYYPDRDNSATTRAFHRSIPGPS